MSLAGCRTVINPLSPQNSLSGRSGGAWRGLSNLPPVTPRCRPDFRASPQPYSTPPKLWGEPMELWVSGRAPPGPVSRLLSQVKTQLQAQTVAAMAVGHQHHHQVGAVTPQSSLGRMGSRAGRGCPVTCCLLPAERSGGLGDHLATARPGRTMAGCGWGRAQGHGRLSRAAGHLCLCQGLGAEATGKERGTPVPTPRHPEVRAICLPSPCLRPHHTLTSPVRPPPREAKGEVTDGP